MSRGRASYCWPGTEDCTEAQNWSKNSGVWHGTGTAWLVWHGTGTASLVWHGTGTGLARLGSNGP